MLVLLLRLSVWFWHESRLWDLQQCSTDLTGKTAVVTGANSGECSSHPVASLGASGPSGARREGEWGRGPASLVTPQARLL